MYMEPVILMGLEGARSGAFKVIIRGWQATKGRKIFFGGS